jgi:hypothetical protein
MPSILFIGLLLLPIVIPWVGPGVSFLFVMLAAVILQPLTNATLTLARALDVPNMAVAFELGTLGLIVTAVAAFLFFKMRRSKDFRYDYFNCLVLTLGVPLVFVAAFMRLAIAGYP